MSYVCLQYSMMMTKLQIWATTERIWWFHPPLLTNQNFELFSINSKFTYFVLSTNRLVRNFIVMSTNLKCLSLQFWKEFWKSFNCSHYSLLNVFATPWNVLEIWIIFVGLICIDEAQYIKNTKSQTTKALKKLKAPLRVALSGTPVENNLAELWSVFDFILPKYLGTLKDFKSSYSKPIEVSILLH